MCSHLCFYCHLFTYHLLFYSIINKHEQHIKLNNSDQEAKQVLIIRLPLKSTITQYNVLTHD